MVEQCAKQGQYSNYTVKPQGEFTRDWLKALFCNAALILNVAMPINASRSHYPIAHSTDVEQNGV